MTKFKTTMDVFKVLEKTNCRKCNKPTCLAFAAAVIQGQIALSECPFISEDILKEYGSQKLEYKSRPEQSFIKMMGQLKEQIKQIDLESRAEKLGDKFSNGRLILKIFGKDFGIDKNGEIIWMKKLPKTQKGTTGKGGMSVKYAQKEDNIYLMFLDNVQFSFYILITLLY